MSSKLRWGVLGCAGIAKRSVIPGIQASQTGVVAAIASRNLNTAEETAKSLDIPTAYGSYEALLADETIDAVYIPLPNHLHMEWTIKAAEAGKHVLCEKPIALNADEARRMVDACSAAGFIWLKRSCTGIIPALTSSRISFNRVKSERFADCTAPLLSIMLETLPMCATGRHGEAVPSMM